MKTGRINTRGFIELAAVIATTERGFTRAAQMTMGNGTVRSRVLPPQNNWPSESLPGIQTGLLGPSVPVKPVRLAKDFSIAERLFAITV